MYMYMYVKGVRREMTAKPCLSLLLLIKRLCVHGLWTMYDIFAHQYSLYIVFPW